VACRPQPSTRAQLPTANRQPQVDHEIIAAETTIAVGKARETVAAVAAAEVASARLNDAQVGGGARDPCGVDLGGFCLLPGTRRWC
jgi:hypothetical protein